MSAASEPPTAAARPRPQSAGLVEVERVDRAVYTAIAGTDTPRLDRAMRRLSRAADHSKLSITAGAMLALSGGRRGRQAAVSGLASVAATATIVNVLVKPVGRRRRPDRATDQVPVDRQVRMPASRSFPSGHTAAATAFASGVGRVWPVAGIPLQALAALVGYSRVHTGVHYPGDVLGGALLGTMISDATAGVIAARRAPRGAGLPRRRG
ncbi:MAG TPA: phosphatase PAP2 family protein [Solirubrobacteraceae bacterium]|nr:phosphatase PAP2 family protein [Solirubrobacteraceae bacterium]